MVSLTILLRECPNTPTDDELCHSDSDQGMLQMLVQEEMPLNFNGEVVEYLNLEKARMVPPHFCQLEAKQVEK